MSNQRLPAGIIKLITNFSVQLIETFSCQQKLKAQSLSRVIKTATASLKIAHNNGFPFAIKQIICCLSLSLQILCYLAETTGVQYVSTVRKRAACSADCASVSESPSHSRCSPGSAPETLCELEGQNLQQVHEPLQRAGPGPPAEASMLPTCPSHPVSLLQLRGKTRVQRRRKRKAGGGPSHRNTD